MGKRKGTLLSFTSLVFAFMLATLFFYMVYNTHFDSATDDFSGLVVYASSYESEPGAQKKEKFDAMKDDLVAWASNHRAVLFYKGFSAAGIAAVDYANWFESTWNVSFTGQDPKRLSFKMIRESWTAMPKIMSSFQEFIITKLSV